MTVKQLHWTVHFHVSIWNDLSNTEKTAAAQRAHSVEQRHFNVDLTSLINVETTLFKLLPSAGRRLQK